MAEVTVLQLAERLSIPPDRLLQQMKDAGLPHQEQGDAINDDQQSQLLTHLRGVHGESPKPRNKITLKRRETSTLRAGRSTVNVQVRKKRTIVRKPVEPEPVEEPVLEEPEAPAVEAADVVAQAEAPEVADVLPETAEAEESPVEEATPEAPAAEPEEAAEPEAAEAEAEPEAAEAPVEEAPAEEAEEPVPAEDVEVAEPEVAEAPTPVEAEVAKPVAEAPPSKRKIDFANVEALRRAAHAEAVAETERRKEETKRKAQELADKKAAEEAKRQAAADAAAAKRQQEAERERRELEESKVSDRKDRRDRHDLDEGDKENKVSGGAGRRRGAAGRRKNELAHLLDDVDNVPSAPGKRTLGLRAGGRARRAAAPLRKVSVQGFNAPTADIKREVEVGEAITIAQLSQKMSVKAGDLIKTLMSLGTMANINQMIDQDTAVLLVEEYGHTVKLIDADAAEKELEESVIYEGEGVSRAPVVTVMGHVDHGKTSLLDYIRQASVVDGESGGITQHIGAYRAATKHGEICFIDTPGHAAFTAMRARGADCTDVVVLVVAADDGVMPQTEEAVQHAKGAEVPIVVAVNKMDVEGADPERVKNELAARDVIPEEWGGDTQFIQVSAMTGEGIDDLLEAILLQAELQELTAVPDGPATGVVLESQLDKGRGVVATLLVQNGTLKQGDIVVAGQEHGRVRAINDESGKKIKTAGPSTPVSILGLSSPPGAGDSFLVATDDKKAREVAQLRSDKANDARLSANAPASLDNLLENFGAPGAQFLNVVVKADVRGSLEAITSSLLALGNDEVKVNVVGSGVGAITETDANYAITADAVIFGFNVRADNAARKLIEREGLDLRYYKVIYDIVDDVRDALSGMLSPEVREEIVGIAEVRQVFSSRKLGQIAGCMVTEGTVSRNKKIRVLRDNVVIYEGELESLRHFKEEVADISRGSECGIGVRNYNDVREGDQIEVFDTREVARAL